MSTPRKDSTGSRIEISAGWRRPFFSMWIGQTLSLAGSRVVQFALVWWLAIQTDRATVLTTATIVALVPEIILSPIAGVYIDRWNRRLVMIVADGIVAIGAFVLGFLYWSGAIEIWHIYALMFLRALAGSFHWPAIQASTSLMVPDEHLTRVNGLNQAVNGLLTIIGPVLGALVVETLLMYQVMAIDLGTALIAVLPLLFITIPQPRRKDLEEEPASVKKDLIFGFRYVLAWRGLVAIIGAAMIIHLVLTPAFTLMPLLVKNHFGGGATELGFLEGTAGVGMLLGGVILSVWGGFSRRIYTSLIGMSLLGLSLIALGFTPAALFWLALVCVFFLGLMIPFVDGPIMAIMQANVDPEVQARVFTMIGSLLSITSPIGLLIAGPLSDIFDIRLWFVAAGLGAVVAGIGLLLVPSVVNIEEGREKPLIGMDVQVDDAEVIP